MCFTHKFFFKYNIEHIKLDKQEETLKLLMTFCLMGEEKSGVVADSLLYLIDNKVIIPGIHLHFENTTRI